MTREAINDSSLTPAERLAALRSYLQGGRELPELLIESNNHVHTIYSFSPYTPSMAALRAREAGLCVVGSVDHDSVAAAAEMTEAAGLLGLGVVTGFECRVYMHSAEEVASGRALLHGRKLNNPDTAGIAYMTVQGIPARCRAAAAEFLDPIREARLRRTAEMAERANTILAGIGAPTIDVEGDIVAASQFRQGGTVTERHLLAAMAAKLIECFGRGRGLVDGLARLGIVVGGRLGDLVADADNPHLLFDLLGVMKAEFLAQVYVVPGRDECPTMAETIAFATSIDAIACYAYLGDVTASPTGDKKAERFEDGFLDELVDQLERLGMPAITYMPPRNTAEQMARVARLAAAHGMLEVSGVDINTPRQEFNCPELRRPELAHLNDATWAMLAHERLAEADGSLGLCAAGGPLAALPLPERVARYAAAGRGIVAGETTVEEAAVRLRKEAS